MPARTTTTLVSPTCLRMDELCASADEQQRSSLFAAVFPCKLATVMRTVHLTFVLVLAFSASASANWFNKSEEYLAACEREAAHRYYKDTSSKDVRRHVYSCMIAHGYVFQKVCDEEGWIKPDCYRLRFKTEGR